MGSGYTKAIVISGKITNNIPIDIHYYGKLHR
jgi:ribosomal protein L30E